MDNNENNIFIRPHEIKRFRRRKSEGSLDENFLNNLDRYGENLASYYYDDISMQKKLSGNFKREPRSWHPSPYASEDEDDQIVKKEKTAEIRNEIPKRRPPMIESDFNPEFYKLCNYPNAINYYPNDRFYNSYNYKLKNNQLPYSTNCYHELSLPNYQPRSSCDRYYSRSLDTGYDDYTYDYQDSGYLNNGRYQNNLNYLFYLN